MHLQGHRNLPNWATPWSVSRTLRMAKLWLQCMDYIEVINCHIPVVARLSIFLAGALLVPRWVLPVDLHIQRINCWTFAGSASRGSIWGKGNCYPFSIPIPWLESWHCLEQSIWRLEGERSSYGDVLHAPLVAIVVAQRYLMLPSLPYTLHNAVMSVNPF